MAYDIDTNIIKPLEKVLANIRKKQRDDATKAYKAKVHEPVPAFDNLRSELARMADEQWQIDRLMERMDEVERRLLAIEMQQQRDAAR